MSLVLLKNQIEDMNNKIKKLTSDLEKKTIIITNLESEYSKINEQLQNERASFELLNENKNYLIEVQKGTETNYLQIESAATTLLEILKSKTDKI
jgi:hypothetical protein